MFCIPKKKKIILYRNNILIFYTILQNTENVKKFTLVLKVIKYDYDKDKYLCVCFVCLFNIKF